MTQMMLTIKSVVATFAKQLKFLIQAPKYYSSGNLYIIYILQIRQLVIDLMYGVNFSILLQGAFNSLLTKFCSKNSLQYLINNEPPDIFWNRHRRQRFETYEKLTRLCKLPGDYA